MSKLNVGNDSNDNNMSTQVASTNADQYLKVNYNNSIKDLLVPTKDTLDRLKGSGVVYSAKKLETGTNLNTDLSKTDSFNFDGSTETGTLGVTGTLPIEHGGTGSPTRNGALRALINGGSGFTGDINTLTSTGVYWIDLSNCTNGPTSSGYGTMEVISYEVILQRFTSYQDGNVYCRTYTNSQWYEWREIFGTKSTVPISSGGTGNTTRTLALTALLAGGSGATDANIVASGTYVLTTDTASNLPPEQGQYLLTVFRYDTSDLACGQIAILLGNGNLYSRDYVGGNWKDWVCCSSRKIDTIKIPNGADLNNYRDKGFYASSRASNSIANLPSGLGSGAFELVVTGIDADGLYCTQWLKSYERNRIWIRTQFSSKEPWVWRDWQEVVMSDTINTLELGKTLSSTAGYGGAIDFHFNGKNTSDYTTRIIESQSGRLNVDGNFDVKGQLKCSNGFWVAGGGFHVDTSTYGTSLPAAGNTGRIFFKKI